LPNFLPYVKAGEGGESPNFSPVLLLEFLKVLYCIRLFNRELKELKSAVGHPKNF
jgi:hypothetical protein